MTEKVPTMVYDAETRRAVITFPNGRELKIAGVSQEHADRFLARHAGEFMRRDCTLETVEGVITREASTDG